jgi:hypothetical protein
VAEQGEDPPPTAPPGPAAEELEELWAMSLRNAPRGFTRQLTQRHALHPQAERRTLEGESYFSAVHAVAEVVVRLLERILAPAGGDDDRAPGMQSAGDRAAEAAGGAREQDATAIERHSHGTAIVLLCAAS